MLDLKGWRGSAPCKLSPGCRSDWGTGGRSQLYEGPQCHQDPSVASSPWAPVPPPPQPGSLWLLSSLPSSQAVVLLDRSRSPRGDKPA